MRIGLVTKLETDTLDFLARHGFGSVELLVEPGGSLDPRRASQSEILQVKEHCAARNIEISALGYYANHLDAARQDEIRAHFLGVMDAARMLGVGVVASFAGRAPEKSIADNIPAFKAYWSELAQRALDGGLKIAFENCPMFHTHPFRGINLAFTPKAWDMMFDAVPSAALGLEWDPSHLVCMQIDPLWTIRKYAKKIFHVHAKDAEVRWSIVRHQGIYDEDATRHRMPGLGQVDWREVVSALIEHGYRGNLDIEGRHDPIYGGALEEAGLLIARDTLRQYVR